MAAVGDLSYLGLCNRLIQKCGISGNPLATTANQSGEMARVVNWINEEYLAIQEMNPDWDFMTADFSFNTVAGQQVYTPSQANTLDFASWDQNSMRVYFTTPGIRTEVFLQWMDWDYFRDWYLYGNNRVTPGMPIAIAQRPSDHALALGLLPEDRGYTIDGQYRRAPQQFVNDTDVPIIPTRFQMLIVYRAMQRYGMYESAGEFVAEGKQEFAAMLKRMESDQLMPIRVGAPLA